MKPSLTEDAIEQYQLRLLQNLGYVYHHGYDLQPTDSPSPTGRGARGEGERENFGDVVLKTRLQQAIDPVTSILELIEYSIQNLAFSP